MEFLILCSTRYLTHLLHSLVRYRFEHSKRNSISQHAMYYSLRIFVLKVRERLRQAVDKNNTLEAELEETREKVIIYM